MEQIESVLEPNKVKQSHYRPGQTVRAPGVLRLLEFLKIALEDGKVVSHTHRPPLSLGNSHYSHLSEVGSTPWPQCGGKIKSIINPSDPIGNRTR